MAILIYVSDIQRYKDCIKMYFFFFDKNSYSVDEKVFFVD